MQKHGEADPDAACLRVRPLGAPPLKEAAADEAVFQIPLATLVPPRQVRATQLELSFDCLLQWRGSAGWHLRIVDAPRWSWWPWRRRTHHVQIVLDNPDSPRGVVRFDGEIWRRFGHEDAADGAQP